MEEAHDLLLGQKREVGQAQDGLDQVALGVGM